MSRRRIKMTSGLRPGGVPGGIMSGIIKAMADGGGPRRIEAEEAAPTAAERAARERRSALGFVILLIVIGLAWLFYEPPDPTRQHWY